MYSFASMTKVLLCISGGTDNTIFQNTISVTRDRLWHTAHLRQHRLAGWQCWWRQCSKNTTKIPSFCEQNKGEAASYTPLACGAAGLKLRDEGNKQEERASGARNANLTESSICCGTQEGISGRTPTLIVHMGGYTHTTHIMHI